jgi:RNA-binding protein
MLLQAVMIAANASGAGPGTRQFEILATVPLSGQEKRALRARAHHLNPVVSIGAAGVNDAVLAELDIALDGHELVKLRIAADDREHRKKLIDDLCRLARADLIQRIGHTAVLYRERSKD